VTTLNLSKVGKVGNWALPRIVSAASAAMMVAAAAPA